MFKDLLNIISTKCIIEKNKDDNENEEDEDEDDEEKEEKEEKEEDDEDEDIEEYEDKIEEDNFENDITHTKTNKTDEINISFEFIKKILNNETSKKMESYL